MSDKRSSVFADEWRQCLEEHYKYVVKNEDKATEETLVPYLHRFGFTEDDLRQLYVQSTMRADEMPDDFVPDIARATGEEVKAKEATPVSEQLITSEDKTFQAHPNECQCPSCMDLVMDVGHDQDGQPLEYPAEPEEGEGNIFPVAKPETKADEDSPKQKSMF